MKGSNIMVEKIKLAQGAGGEQMDRLIKEKILTYGFTSFSPFNRAPVTF